MSTFGSAKFGVPFPNALVTPAYFYLILCYREVVLTEWMKNEQVYLANGSFDQSFHSKLNQLLKPVLEPNELRFSFTFLCLINPK